MPALPEEGCCLSLQDKGRNVIVPTLNRVKPRQPRLMNEWGCEFFGDAKTITGDFWWYEDDGKRYPLLPLEGVKCARPEPH
jgi:hypothetical protein